MEIGVRDLVFKILRGAVIDRFVDRTQEFTIRSSKKKVFRAWGILKAIKGNNKRNNAKGETSLLVKKRTSVNGPPWETSALPMKLYSSI